LTRSDFSLIERVTEESLSLAFLSVIVSKSSVSVPCVVTNALSFSYVVYFSDKVVSENELQELEELSKILSTYKEKVHLKRQVSKCLWNS
jgi:hypothetical protein